MESRSTSQCQDSRPNGSSNASKRKPIYNLIATVIDVVINLPVMYAVWRERSALNKLSIEQLQDIGIHPYHAKIECSRRFYDLPFERKIRGTESGLQFVRSIVKRRF